MKDYLIVKDDAYKVLERKSCLFVAEGRLETMKELRRRLNGGCGFNGWTPFFVVRNLNEARLEAAKKNQASTRPDDVRVAGTVQQSILRGHADRED